jgi:hypothetical protein
LIFICIMKLTVWWLRLRRHVILKVPAIRGRIYNTDFHRFSQRIIYIYMLQKFKNLWFFLLCSKIFSTLSKIFCDWCVKYLLPLLWLKNLQFILKSFPRSARRHPAFSWGGDTE